MSDPERSAMKVPEISAPELMKFAKALFPSADVDYVSINPEYRSWRIEIKKGKELFLDISWGPLSGFGGSDVLNIPEEESNPFDPYEVCFDSMDAAKKWLNLKK